METVHSTKEARFQFFCELGREKIASLSDLPTFLLLIGMRLQNLIPRLVTTYIIMHEAYVLFAFSGVIVYALDK